MITYERYVYKAYVFGSYNDERSGILILCYELIPVTLLLSPI